ncbi:MAG: hypothetical protein ACRDHW_02755 [Ktedonobacteraceae bacterium]
MKMNLRQQWRTQANLFDVERKFTGEINQAGESTYYYEKSFSFPGCEKQVLLEDREAHSASCPFCPDLFCPCHWEDQAMIRHLSRIKESGILSEDEARAVFHGQRALSSQELTYSAQAERKSA